MKMIVPARSWLTVVDYRRLKVRLGNPVSEVALPSKSVQQCRVKS